jgi:hypothetical protein
MDFASGKKLCFFFLCVLSVPFVYFVVDSLPQGTHRGMAATKTLSMSTLFLPYFLRTKQP